MLPRLHRDAALVRRPRAKPIERARLVDHALWERRRRELAARAVRRRRRRASRRATSCRWRSPGKTPTRSACARSRRRRSPRCASRPASACWPTRSADEAFCRAVVARDRRGARDHDRRRARCASRRRARSRRSPAPTLRRRCRCSRPHGAAATRSSLLGERLFLKGYRRLRPGVNPEVEIGRFLTDVAHFPNCVPLAGVVEYVDSRRHASTTLALLQAYVRNQGDGWTYTRRLPRALPRERARATREVRRRRARRLPRADADARRAHRASCTSRFAQRTGDPAFDPEPVTAPDLAAWTQRVRDDAGDDARPAGRGARPRCPARCVPTRSALLDGARAPCCARIDALRMPRGSDAQDAPPRRLPPRARCCCARTTSSSSTSKASPRARSQERRAQALAAARRRRHAALVRLRAPARRCAHARRVARGRARSWRRSPRDWEAQTRDGLPRGLRRDRARRRALRRATPTSPRAARAVRAREGALRAALRAEQPARLGRACRSRASWPLAARRRATLNDRRTIMDNFDVAARAAARLAAADRRLPAAPCAGARGRRRRLAARQGGALRAGEGAARDQLPRADRARRHRRASCSRAASRATPPTSSACSSTGWSILAALIVAFNSLGLTLHHRPADARACCSCRALMVALRDPRLRRLFRPLRRATR